MNCVGNVSQNSGDVILSFMIHMGSRCCWQLLDLVLPEFSRKCKLTPMNSLSNMYAATCMCSGCYAHQRCCLCTCVVYWFAGFLWPFQQVLMEADIDHPQACCSSAYEWLKLSVTQQADGTALADKG